ncbi:hypothetical protein BJ138DRAFT_1156357 [Hygrophoropsis aurantiaca]|uniref:Uncharacterized protein n=1 Tax=Hygrophoropsis aurantiaca TaxID=72124 RepID=A0ACB8A6Z6_9AGAM|nr:hypothetical protein BJ138DRAFT_1156357 [Hygrophoropsis aurantiaca]
MNRPSATVLAQLAASPNDVAAGIAQCVQALIHSTTSSTTRTFPIMVEYAGPNGLTTKAFGRQHLSRIPFRTVFALIKSSLNLPDTARVTAATFYKEDGVIDPTHIQIDQDSWSELVPFIHSLHVEEDRPALSPGAAGRLNLNANAFVPGGSGVALKNANGTRVDLQSLRKQSLSPTSTVAVIPSPIS